MSDELKVDQFKEKYRPVDSALEKEVDAALGGVSMEALYAFDKPKPAPAGGVTGQGGQSGHPGAVGGASGGVAPGYKGPRRGKIVSISKDDVFVDLGGKSQGIAALIQFEEEPKVGDEIDFIVERYDEREGLLILTRKGATASNVSWENLEVGQVVEGVVSGVNKGGLELEIKGMRAFMPAGQIDIVFHKDISVFLGQKLQVEVSRFERESRNLIVSRRNILEREKEELRKKLVEELEVGQTRRGTVRTVMDFGAFVDLGGADGLLHVSEMSHRRGINPSEIVKVGDIVDVKIIKFDKETGKMSLSLKQAMPDPWVGIENRYAPGAGITGRVTKVESFGCFIEVEEGIEGLLPVSEMSWQRIRHPSDILKVGDTTKLVVLSVDPVAKKMSFSLKQAGPDPWSTVKDRYALDMVVSGKVTRVVDFGAFIELEPGLEGLVHISELSDRRVKSASDAVKQGQDVQVRVLEIDKDARRMSLSIRRAAEVAAPVAPAPEAAPATPVKKKKRPELRGGLDWNW